jgi:hypothetical protein
LVTADAFLCVEPEGSLVVVEEEEEEEAALCLTGCFPEA